MASKLKCPKCKLVLKEQGDHGKSAQGEYKVIPTGNINYVRCIPCNHEAPAIKFLDM